MKALLDKLFRRPPPVILDARAGDAAALAALHGRAFAHGWSESEFERLLADKAVVAHVARAGNRRRLPDSCCRAAPPMRRKSSPSRSHPPSAGGESPARCSRGIWGGSRRSESPRVFLEVDDGNRPALQLYARAGFREVGRRAGYYARAEGARTALTLRRDLV